MWSIYHYDYGNLSEGEIAAIFQNMNKIMGKYDISLGYFYCFFCNNSEYCKEQKHEKITMCNHQPNIENSTNNNTIAEIIYN